MAITSPTDFIDVVSTASPLASAEMGEWKGQRRPWGNCPPAGAARPRPQADRGLRKTGDTHGRACWKGRGRNPSASIGMCGIGCERMRRAA